MAQLEADGEFAEQLFTHGLGVQTAEGIAEWLHALRAPRPRHRAATRAGATRGATPRARSSPSTRRSSACSTRPSIGLRLSGGYAVEPEQSTVAIVAHHPQAVYFGMKSGFLPKTDRQARDELIAGTDRDPASLDAALPESDPAERGRAGHERPGLAATGGRNDASASVCQPSIISSSDMPRDLALVEELLRGKRREQRVHEVVGARVVAEDLAQQEAHVGAVKGVDGVRRAGPGRPSGRRT